MKKIIKLLTILMTSLVMLGEAKVTKAAEFEPYERKTVTVTTEKQLKAAAKDDSVGVIEIKPKKATTFDFKGLETTADIHIHLATATIKNIEEAQVVSMKAVVTNQKQLDKACEMSRITNIEVKTEKKEEFDFDKDGYYLIIDTPKSKWTIDGKESVIEVTDLKNGTITDNGGNVIRFVNDVKKVTIGSEAVDTEIQVSQEKVSKPIKITIKGKVKFLTMYSATPVEITFDKKTKTENITLKNYTGQTINFTINGKKQKAMTGFISKNGKILTYDELFGDND